MEKRKVPTDTFVYNTFLMVCQHSKAPAHHSLATRIFRKMCESREFPPDAVTISILLKMVNSMSPEAAASFADVLINEIRKGKIEVDLVLLNSAISACNPGPSREIVKAIFDYYIKTGPNEERGYVAYARHVAFCLRTDLARLTKNNKYPPKGELKRVIREASTEAERTVALLQAAKLPFTNDLARQLAWIASQAESPHLATWVKGLIDRERVEVDANTLRPLIGCLRAGSQHDKDREELVDRLRRVRPEPEPPRPARGTAGGKQRSSAKTVQEDEPEDEGLVDGVYVDPEESHDFNFTRVDAKK